jgi:hypothetical protein
MQSRRLRLIQPGDPRRDEPKPIGVADSGPARPVVLPVPGARHHIHVVGHTGSGKSTELLNLILADARAGRGVAVFDPKGDLVNDVLARLPAACGSRLVVIDPVETEVPPSLNILDAAGRDDELVIENVAGVLRRLYADTWGPRIDDTLRSAVRTLIGHPGVTLADVPVLLTNMSMRQRLTARFRRDDPEGLGAFWDGYEALTPAGAAQACGPLLSKLRPILGRRFVADLLGSATSSFTMADILDGGILLARLPKGVLGDDACRLVGSLLLAQLWQTALTRASLPEDERPDAAAYIDEAHNFLHLPIGLDDALGEARGYHLSLVLAHQHLAQLPKEMAEALHANACQRPQQAVLYCQPRRRETARRARRPIPGGRGSGTARPVPGCLSARDRSAQHPRLHDGHPARTVRSPGPGRETPRRRTRPRAAARRPRPASQTSPVPCTGRIRLAIQLCLRLTVRFTIRPRNGQ